MVARVQPSPYDDAGYWTTGFREARHNPCLMAPLSLSLFFIFALFFLLTLLFQFPTLLLGLLLSPLLQRAPWYIEFLYPFGIAKWGHFLLLRGSNSKFFPGRKDDKNRGFHSRTAEQKIEVIPGRVYIHPIPQFVDNLGYLVVCLPRPKMDCNSNKLQKKNPKKPKVKEAAKIGSDGGDDIVALLVDCGDANATLAAVKLIERMHYSRRKIHIQVICSTHKHHDHTGGNKDLVEHEDRGKSIERVYGGAVERVPQCTHPVANGDLLTLPHSGSNDMNELVEMEVVAVPGHTRGSVVYTLRCKGAVEKAAEYMFTGDTMFSAGGGVPFEADIGLETESKLNKSNGNTFIRMGLGQAAMERCFAEILSRALPDVRGDESVGDRILIFPGHEYTAELLSRQFQVSMSESTKWKNFPPEEFFETVSQMYVALHRRSLPHNSGKLLAIPSTINREVIISPNFRGMRRNAEQVVRAIVFWHTHFCKNPVKEEELNSKPSKLPNGKQKKSAARIKTESLPDQWNLDFHDVGREIFTTVYTADLEAVLDDLSSGKIKKQKAIKQLQELKWKLRDPVINRRAIPNALPSDKHIYQGVAALALLGSPPSAMTLTDSRRMNLAPPIDSNSDRILVSKKRLILVLERLGALGGGDEPLAENMVKQLWIEASEYMSHNGTDTEVASASSGELDKIELGVLKWVLYGVPANQPSWFSKACCMPCSSVPPPRHFPSEHPAMSMKKKAGNLVAHDVFTCPLCRDATGCAFADEEEETVPDSPKRGLDLREIFSDESNESGFEVEGLAQQLLRGGSSP